MNNDRKHGAPTIVFYDGGCDLCSREIRFLRRLDRRGVVEWVDINRDMTLLTAFGIDFAQAMRRFHVLDRHGVMRDGVPAFLALWAVLPPLNLAARLVHLTRSVALLESAYEKFARRRLEHRANALCQPRLQAGGR